MTNRGFVGLVSTAALLIGLFFLLIPFDAGEEPDYGGLVRCGTALITDDEYTSAADNRLEYMQTMVSWAEDPHYADDCAAKRSWRLAAGWPLAIAGIVGVGWFLLVRPKDVRTDAGEPNDSATV